MKDADLKIGRVSWAIQVSPIQSHDPFIAENFLQLQQKGKLDIPVMRSSLRFCESGLPASRGRASFSRIRETPCGAKGDPSWPQQWSWQLSPATSRNWVLPTPWVNTRGFFPSLLVRSQTADTLTLAWWDPEHRNQPRSSDFWPTKL